MTVLLTLRIAARSALEDRFRTGALCLIGVIAAAAALLATSASAVRTSEQERSEAMTGVLSDTPRESDLLVLSTTKRIEGRRIDVSYVETLGDQPVRPVGVDRLPPVGGAVVSSALRDVLDSDPELAGRFSVDGTIDPSGTVSGSQLLAYVRVSPGTLSQDGDDILHAVDGAYTGYGPVDRLQGFGARPGTDDLTIQGTGLSDRSFEPTHVQAVWVLTLAPALVLVLVGLGISSEPRTRRLALLQFLGVSRRQRLVVYVAESLFPVTLGVLVACAAWTWVGRQAWLFSGAGYEVVPGDGSLPAATLAGVGLVVVLVCALAAVATAAVTRNPQGTRPVREPSRLTAWVGLPVGLSVGLLGAAATTPSQLSGILALAGSVLAAVSLPLLVPGILHSTGQLIARTPGPATFLTGRFMGFDPVNAARPFAGIATLIVLAGTCAGWIAVANYVEETPGTQHGSQVSVAGWRAASVDDVAGRLRSDLPDLAVAPFAIQGDRITLATSCESVAAAAADVTCNRSGSLGGAGLPKLLRGLQAASHDGPPLARIDFAERTEGWHDDEVVVIGSGSGLVQDARVEAAIGPYVEVPTVEGMSSSPATRSALVPWIELGLAVTSLILGLGCLLLLSDRFRHVMTEHRSLHLMGLHPGQLRRIARLLFTIPYAVIAVVGLLVGTISCYAISAPVGTPWATVGALVALTVAGGLVIGLMLPRRVRLPRVE